MAATGHHDRDDYNMNYPEPPHFGSPMEQLTPESYTSYQRHPSIEFPTTVGYSANGHMFAEAAPFTYHSKSSPGYGDDASDMRVPSSDLSIASASSSNVGSDMGSPISTHGNLAAIPEWAAAPHGLGVTPGIVDQSDYFPGSEYSFAPGAIDGYNPAFDFPSHAKGPGFVGAPSRVIHVLCGFVRVCFHRRAAQAAVVEPSSRHAPRAGLDDSVSCFYLGVLNGVQSCLCVAGHFCVFLLLASAAIGLVQPQPRRPEPTPGAKDAPQLDPSLIHPDVRAMAMPGYEQQYAAASNSAYPASPALSASPQLRSGNTSPFVHNNGYQPFSPFQPPPPELQQQRRQSHASFHSGYSGDQTASGDESKEKQRCPHHDCGKIFKDLRAHMLTHQTERPEKCPIATCEYHVKGFARKYDKNRHTLTHYKGTMVCGFCPGSGSAAEKSFNRADVFKRHLTAVHGVEQTPPNSRKKTGSNGSAAAKNLTGYAPDATGKCSTCSQTFSNAQDFYEHLDDCVLRIVQQEDPAEAINAKRLAEVENDRDVHNTLEKNHLPTTTMTASIEEDEDDDMEDDDLADEDFKSGRPGSASSSSKRKGNPPGGVQKSRGLTHSRGGVPLITKNRGRKNRRDYPSSWGFDKGQMNMKKRVMAVFDGARRLAKDDMMLSTEHEVRVKLPDGKSYVTDLDIQTLQRAKGFLEATDEEKGPWISDDPTEDDIKKMLEISVAQQQQQQQQQQHQQ
ncbi:hypothetical protein B0T14DRAFT_562368 [Immersiella caudata]|uniref:C2H2-type domain-containing protein n=1 Tax=Immersiella caudata TaxID=314043 RepID=A0AA39X3A3_9PEZI|nr:hypothetical protein B0T14DRAFT_562368 [Immersiella caudata]